MTDANAPIDEAILQAIARTLRTDDRVAEVVLIAGEGTTEHKHLAVTLDPARYPAFVHGADLDIFRQRGNPVLKPEGLKGGAESRKLVHGAVQPPSVRYQPTDPRPIVY